MKLKLLFSTLVVSFGLAGAAHAAVPGIATTDVNMRLGPSTSYEVIRVIPGNAPVTIYGCLSGYSWCDVAFGGFRGWVSSRYLYETGRAQRQRHPVYRGGPSIASPIITFELFSYHGRHYANQRWYRDRYHSRYYGRRDATPPRRGPTVYSPVPNQGYDGSGRSRSRSGYEGNQTGNDPWTRR